MKYFAYGMNSEIHGMSMRCPQAKPLGKAILADYSLAMRGVADIIETPDVHMEGALWEITPECEASLDILESYPTYYTKLIVKVEFEGDMVETMVYQMTKECQRGFASASQGYHQTLQLGYQQFGIPYSQLKLANAQADAWKAANPRPTYRRY